MQSLHRIFVAISLPATLQKELASTEKQFPELPAKWTPRENLHITLAFLGNITDLDLAEVCTAAKEVATRHQGFSLTIKDISYGPLKKNPPKIVWATMEPSKELLELQKDLADTIAEKIRYKEDNKFSAHITLARLQEWEFRKFELEERPEVQKPLDIDFFVESIEVMESVMKKGGPVYTVIESHSFVS